jgi:hypothetical protein
MANQLTDYPELDVYEAQYLRTTARPIWAAYTAQQRRRDELLTALRIAWYLVDRVCFGIGAGWIVSRYFLWRYGLI